MYPLLIALGLGFSVATSLMVIPRSPWIFMGIFSGFVVAFPAFMFLLRRTAARVQPLFEKATKLAQSGNVPQAVATLEEARVWSRWQFFLDQQINTQIGGLHYAAGEEKKAIEFLGKGYPKYSEGHLMLASALYRQGQHDEAIQALEKGITFNKRSPLLYNLLAWMLNEKGKREAAIEALTRGLKALGADEETSENLQRLQNEKKMNMRPFGQLWFMLKFETPRGMAQVHPVRKGFRQPPKQRGKARSR